MKSLCIFVIIVIFFSNCISISGLKILLQSIEEKKNENLLKIKNKIGSEEKNWKILKNNLKFSNKKTFLNSEYSKNSNLNFIYEYGEHTLMEFILLDFYLDGLFQTNKNINFYKFPENLNNNNQEKFLLVNTCKKYNNFFYKCEQETQNSINDYEKYFTYLKSEQCSDILTEILCASKCSGLASNYFSKNNFNETYFSPQTIYTNVSLSTCYNLFFNCYVYNSTIFELNYTTIENYAIEYCENGNEMSDLLAPFQIKLKVTKEKYFIHENQKCKNSSDNIKLQNEQLSNKFNYDQSLYLYLINNYFDIFKDNNLFNFFNIDNVNSNSSEKHLILIMNLIFSNFKELHREMRIKIIKILRYFINFVKFKSKVFSSKNNLKSNSENFKYKSEEIKLFFFLCNSLTKYLGNVNYFSNKNVDLTNYLNGLEEFQSLSFIFLNYYTYVDGILKELISPKINEKFIDFMNNSYLFFGISMKNSILNLFKENNFISTNFVKSKLKLILNNKNKDEYIKCLYENSKILAFEIQNKSNILNTTNIEKNITNVIKVNIPYKPSEILNLKPSNITHIKLNITDEILKLNITHNENIKDGHEKNTSTENFINIKINHTILNYQPHNSENISLVRNTTFITKIPQPFHINITIKQNNINQINEIKNVSSTSNKEGSNKYNKTIIYNKTEINVKNNHTHLNNSQNINVIENHNIFNKTEKSNNQLNISEKVLLHNYSYFNNTEKNLNNNGHVNINQINLTYISTILLNKTKIFVKHNNTILNTKNNFTYNDIIFKNITHSLHSNENSNHNMSKIEKYLHNLTNEIKPTVLANHTSAEGNFKPNTSVSHAPSIESKHNVSELTKNLIKKNTTNTLKSIEKESVIPSDNIKPTPTHPYNEDPKHIPLQSHNQIQITPSPITVSLPVKEHENSKLQAHTNQQSHQDTINQNYFLPVVQNTTQNKTEENPTNDPAMYLLAYDITIVGGEIAYYVAILFFLILYSVLLKVIGTRCTEYFIHNKYQRIPSNYTYLIITFIVSLIIHLIIAFILYSDILIILCFAVSSEIIAASIAFHHNFGKQFGPLGFMCLSLLITYKLIILQSIYLKFLFMSLIAMIFFIVGFYIGVVKFYDYKREIQYFKKVRKPVQRLVEESILN